MASAKKCDRCGNYYDANTKYSRNMRYICGLSTLKSRGFGYESVQGVEYDLCDECLDSFYDWLKGEKKAEN